MPIARNFKAVPGAPDAAGKSILARAGKYLGAALVPVLFALIARYLVTPNYFFSYGDPDFGYLMNSARIAAGLGAWHVDHPGTILQLLGAGILQGAKLLNHEADGLSALLGHLNTVYLSTMAASAAMLVMAQFLTGCILIRRGYGLLVAMTVQLAPAFFAEMPFALTRLNSETTQAAMGLMVVAAIVPFLEAGTEPRRRNFVLLGISIAAAMATKANVWPIALLCFIPLFSRKGGPRGSALIIGSATLAFSVLTIPAWGRFGYLSNWIFRLLTHEGIYGQGPAVVTTFADLLRGVEVYAGFGSGKQQVFVVFMAFGLILLALTRRRREYVPVLMAFLAIVFLLIKHPATRYAIALVPVVGCTFLYLPQIPGKLRNFPLIAVILFCLMGLISRTQSVLGLHRSLSQLEQMLREELDTEFRGCAVVMMGELPIKEWGLIYGHGPESADTPWPERLNRIFGRYFWLDDVHVSQFGKNMALADWVKIVNGYPCQAFAFPKFRPAAPLLVRDKFQGNFPEEKLSQPAYFRLLRHNGPLVVNN